MNSYRQTCDLSRLRKKVLEHQNKLKVETSPIKKGNLLLQLMHLEKQIKIAVINQKSGLNNITAHFVRG
ncbi:hypothetical protein [Thalassotalea crassostreae]|uniref:hypothetical protein n=1 Tax=Thalassotalea crassostreae TaxID=1763536 RepID=UPI0008392979|nr:hypothetical protein [Thalassotalea crassostreae]